MKEAQKTTVVTDPDRVQEMFCDGTFNVRAVGPLATLTFTHTRPTAATMFLKDFEKEVIVRARIVISRQNMLALRDLLVRLTATEGTSESRSGGSRLN